MLQVWAIFMLARRRIEDSRGIANSGFQMANLKQQKFKVGEPGPRVIKE
jgi:hypothetical protein